MVWKTQDELKDARKRPQNTNPGDTLFGAALGIIHEDPPEFLRNDAFLDQLVKDRRIERSYAEECLERVKKGADEGILNALNQPLFYSSLPETYAYEDIALLLGKTKKFIDDTAGRLRRTDAVIHSVVKGLKTDGGTGMHEAFVKLGKRHQDVDARNGTEPGSDIRYINQVSLAYTLLTFSFSPFHALGREGQDKFSDDQKDAWLHMWNVVGSLMGIESGGCPDGQSDAQAMWKAVLESPPYEYTEEGHDLTKALIALAGQDKKQLFFRYGGKKLMDRLGIKE